MLAIYVDDQYYLKQQHPYDGEIENLVDDAAIIGVRAPAQIVDERAHPIRVSFNVVLTNGKEEEGLKNSKAAKDLEEGNQDSYFAIGLVEHISNIKQTVIMVVDL